MKVYLLFIYLLLFIYVEGHKVSFQDSHSNYGDDKRNKQHIEEHLKTLNQDKELPELNEKDMIYYLFVLHDLNGDGHLDGHELRSAFTDFEEDQLESLEDLTDMVDHVLLEDDKNGDGLISWSEYLESQLYHHD